MLVEVIIVEVPASRRVSGLKLLPHRQVPRNPQPDPNIFHSEKRHPMSGTRYLRAWAFLFLLSLMSTLLGRWFFLNARQLLKRTIERCTPDFGQKSAEGFPSGRQMQEIRTHSAPSVGQRRDHLATGRLQHPQEPRKRVLRQFSCQGSGLQFLRRTECEPLLSTNVTLFLTTGPTLVCKSRSLTPRM